MPAASYALLPNLKKGLFLPSERDRDFLLPVFYKAAPKCICIRRLAGARHLSSVVFVNTTTRWWIGAHDERAPFRFHMQSLVFSIDCLSRTRNPAASNKRLAEFSQADLGPRSAQEILFSGFLKSLKLFYRRFVLMASGTEIFRRMS